MSETEQTLVKKARELTKLEAKLDEAKGREITRRADAGAAIDEINKDIARVRGEISTLIQPVVPAASPVQEA